MPNDEEKEQKPKKMFVITHIVYDDGEVDTDMSEYRKSSSGRGAPSKWRLNAKDFKRRVGELLGDFDTINETMNNNVNGEFSAMKNIDGEDEG